MYTIFTADVEGHVGNDPVEHLIYGKTEDGRLCGIDMLMDLLDQHNIKGLFFVDIAEAWDYGEKKIAGVLQHINKRGHDVGVHIHPDHMADSKRMFLSEYSKEEQFKIIKKCTDFYEEILGRKPIAFRAGKYGANWDTLDILAQLGYKADFSQFYGQKWCHIDPPCACVRREILLNGIMEIPVSIFKSFDALIYNRIDKIDATQPFLEFQHVMKEFVEGDYCDTIVLFAHSFSLINWRNKPDAPSYNFNKYKRIMNQIEFVSSNNNYELCSLSCILDRKILGDFNDSQRIPSIYGVKSWVFFLYRSYLVLQSRIDIFRRYLSSILENKLS